MAASAFDELKWRGLIFDFMEGVPELLAKEKVTIYNGFDATADSLHVGSLVPILALARLQRFGHHVIAVAGGGTTMVGDPSGKSSERRLMTKQDIDANVESIKQQLAHFLDFEVKTNPARLVNNADWLLDLKLIEFLRDIGKHFTVNYMLEKESVRTRLERQDGLSFTEFSYMLMQSYDFLHLFDRLGCSMQTGGSDQWGNITAGAELVRRMRGKPAYGMVFPLIVKSDGTKFGKTESGSIWLKAERTSPYKFFQFWLNAEDRDVVPYLRLFTFLSQEEIAVLEDQVKTRPEQRQAQRILAREVTRMLHGETALGRAEQATQVLFGGNLTGLSTVEIADIFSDVPSSQVLKGDLEGNGMNVVDLMMSVGMTTSKGESRRAIQEGGFYLNNARVADVLQMVTLQDALEGQFIVLRRGAKNYRLVRVNQG
jgi:tyrosyl-tRNA synthetase